MIEVLLFQYYIVLSIIYQNIFKGGFFMKLKKMHLPFILITIILSSSIVQFDAFADDTNSFVKGGTTIELSAEELESKNRIENDIATVKSDKQNNPEKYVNYSSRNN